MYMIAPCMYVVAMRTTERMQRCGENVADSLR